MDAESIYDVPLLMLREKLDTVVITRLRLKDRREPNLQAWKGFLGKLKNPTYDLNIGLVGKYNELQDAYKSIHESFVHAGAVNECKVQVYPIHSEQLEGNGEEAMEKLKDFDGVLVAPGFGERGIEGKIKAIQYVREAKVPFFGICLGMQCAVVEYARNIMGLEGASSTEVDPSTPHPIIDLMAEQKKITKKGGTMRLGAYACEMRRRTKASSAYGSLRISERHRHRYEFNNQYREDMEKAGMLASGINPDSELVEIIEVKDHPWFVGVQFHPELKSTVEVPHPLFVSFVKACVNRKYKSQR